MDIFRKINFNPKPKKLTTVVMACVGLATVSVPVYIFATNLLQQQLNKQSEVQTVVVQKPVEQIVAALGRIQTKNKIISLSGPSALQTARLDKVLVKEGDRVNRGQVIAVLDTIDQLNASLAKAQMGVKTASAQLAQVKAGTAKQGEITAAQAQIANLQSQFQGDISIKKARINGLSAQLKNAQTEYTRYQSLYSKGAIAAVTKDNKFLAVQTFQAQLQEAKNSLKQTLSTSPSQIAEAKANLKKLNEVRPVDVEVAQTQLEKERGAVQEAKANLALAYVKSPIDGKILKVNSFPGETISEKGIIELAQTQEMYVVTEIYETDISKIKVGQTASITSMALPRKLTGTVEIIGVQIGKRNVVSNDPAINIDSRVAEVKIRLNPEDVNEAANFLNLQVDVHVKVDNI